MTWVSSAGQQVQWEPDSLFIKVVSRSVKGTTTKGHVGSGTLDLGLPVLLGGLWAQRLQVPGLA